MNRDKHTIEVAAGKPQIRRSIPKPLTTATINAIKPGKLLADGAIRPGFGSLKIRKRVVAGGNVCEWVFEWSRSGKTMRQSIGRYSANETPGSFTLVQARAEAGRLQAIIKSGNDPLEQREAERHAARARVETEKSLRKTANEKSLAALLAAYVENLREKKKTKSAYDAENIFANHILKPFPEIANLPAAEVTPEHFSKILGRLVRPEVDVKKGRTALKLRSYAGAAYKMSQGASLDPMATSSAHEFGVKINPVAAVPVTKMAAAFNRVGERALSTDELITYLGYVAAMDHSLPKLALQLQIATCGQRMQQLLRITYADANGRTLTIYDPKGKRLMPRVHLLPIVQEVEEILTALRLMNPPTEELGQETPLFYSRRSLMALDSISGEVLKISDAMLAEKLTQKPFRAGDIRRTVETMLAENLLISKDTRAQLLSHGLSGVQDRNYDKGTHLIAKTDAMRKWNDFVADLCIGANQVPK
jgi:integrase